MGDLGGPFDAIVIGSGISGLASANILAMHGKRVLMVEQHYRFGGYLQNFMLHRTPFDSGCHYVGALGENQVFDRYLRYLGVRDDIEACPLDADGFDVIDREDWSFRVPVGYTRLRERLVEEFPHQGEAIGRFLEEAQAEVRQFPMYTLEAADDPRGASAAPSRTLRDVFDALGVADPRLREILALYSVIYLVPEEEAPFGLHALVFDSFIQGAFTIRGGGHALQKALVARLRARGGVARRRTRVTEIEVRDRKVVGVRTADGAYEKAPLIIAAIDPHVLLKMLPLGATRPAFRHRIERMQHGIGGLAAYLRVDADLSRFARANYFIRGAGQPLASHFTEDWLERGLPPVFLTVPSAREERWKGPQSVIVISSMRQDAFAQWSDTHTGSRGSDYEAFRDEIGRRLLEASRRVMPEIDSALLSVDYASPLTHRDYTLNGGGAPYGLHHSVDQSFARGVGWRTPVQGLYLAGHSVLFPGLIGATISAFYACGEVLGASALHREVLRA